VKIGERAEIGFLLDFNHRIEPVRWPWPGPFDRLVHPPITTRVRSSIRYRPQNKTYVKHEQKTKIGALN
jgi:hypothetical protein